MKSQLNYFVKLLALHDDLVHAERLVNREMFGTDYHPDDVSFSWRTHFEHKKVLESYYDSKGHLHMYYSGLAS